MKFNFILSRANQPIGQIVWLCGGDDGNGSITGDQQAIFVLQQSINMAIQQAWRGNFPLPRRVVVQNPLNYISEMVTVIEQGGFDMPDVLLPYTAAEQKRKRQLNFEQPPSGTLCY